LLLHGGGEIGNTGQGLSQNRAQILGRPYVQVWRSPLIQNRWPSFVLVPQLLDDNRWVDLPATHGSYQLSNQPSNALRLAKEIAVSIAHAYTGVDPDRLYITGISTGAYGVWDAIERWPSLFAAALPLAGAGDPSHAAALAAMPIWILRGADDGEVPASGSCDMVEAIRAAGGHPHYTQIPNAGHDIWMQVYTSPGVLSWLFGQSAVHIDLLRKLQRLPLRRSSDLYAS
jgi:predicted peptidase